MWALERGLVRGLMIRELLQLAEGRHGGSQQAISTFEGGSGAVAGMKQVTEGYPEAQPATDTRIITRTQPSVTAAEREKTAFWGLGAATLGSPASLDPQAPEQRLHQHSQPQQHVSPTPTVALVLLH
ncbi:hypothetical protein KUCAC02_012019 [Chaenocephalus aceratus]|uniref:Uncharacterized protein n=1 Tax=Chaenocephalus aceratus TaxID=36190 RepID=A0ACB9XB43_CHAAC|nr:hypothetical protein KUCAC02_012019 [Chaenocephalus aceratus]